MQTCARAVAEAMKEMITSTPSPEGASASKTSQGLNLACRECQRKKIKCSRTYPCEQCTRASLPCYPSSRKPRVKAGAKAVDAELRSRIAKLERLVETFSGEDGKLPPMDTPRPSSHSPQRPVVAPAISAVTSSPASTGDVSSTDTTRYVAGSFWASLTTEVKALAEAFEEDASPSGDENTTPDQTPPYGAPAPAGRTTYELIFCPPGALHILPGAATEPTPAVAAELLAAFLSHVEPMYKLFHVPTLKALMQDGQPYLKRAPDAPCNKALKAAVYFAGANALNEDECQIHYGKTRDELVNEFRGIMGLALYHADTMNTNEIATLQALVLYVARDQRPTSPEFESQLTWV